MSLNSFLKNEINGIPYWLITTMQIGLMVFLFITAYLIYRLLPPGGSYTFGIFGCDLFTIKPNTNSRIFLLVMLCGALGSFVHASHSFVTFVGMKKIEGSWLWWYISRPFIGMALAMVFYFLYAAGGSLESILNGNIKNDNNKPLNLYALLAASSMIGMFSKQAIDKLGELFKVLFQSKAVEERDKKDALTDK